MAVQEGPRSSTQVPVLVEHVGAQAAALAEVLLAVSARERPLARVAALVPVEVARVGEGAGALVAPEGPLARVHARVDAHVAAAAAPVAALVALHQAPPVAVGGHSGGPGRRPGDHHAWVVTVGAERGPVRVAATRLFMNDSS